MKKLEAAQSFNFAPKLPKIGEFSVPIFLFLDENFPAKKIHPTG